MYMSKLYYYIRQFSSVRTHSFGIKNLNFFDDYFENNITTNYTVELKASNNVFDANTREEIMERITCFLYYLNFATNFFLYSFCARSFRQQFLKYLKKIPLTIGKCCMVLVYKCKRNKKSYLKSNPRRENQSVKALHCDREIE